MKPPFPRDQLKDLPHEIHLAIMEFLDPFDIISLSKTCHSFHTTCSEITVWTSAFRRMCSLNFAFMPSYPPIEDMSIAELCQHAASPSRLTALLSKQKGFALGHTRPYRSQRYIQRTDIGTILDVFLVPGGRYLITTAEHLYIWDLGLTTQGDPSLVATFRGGLNFILGIQQTPDGDAILIAVSASRASAETSIVSYNPSSSTKELSPLATVNHPNPDICVLANPLFIYIHDDALVFWNFHDDLWASYVLDVGDMVTNIACQKATLFLFYEETIRGYKLPNPSTLKPRAEFLSQPRGEKSLHQIFTLAAVVHTQLGLNRLIDTLPLEMWYEGGSSLFSFDLAFWLEPFRGNYSSLVSCYIQSQSSATDSAHTDWKLTTQYDFQNLIAEGVLPFSRGNVRRRRICNDYDIRTAQNGSNLTVLATDLWADDPVLLTADFLLPELHLHRTSQRYTFDPISGRMCIPDRQGRIVVLDFLHQGSH